MPVLASLFAGLWVSARAQEPLPAPVPLRPRVAKVTVVVHDIFDPAIPAENNWLFRRANDLHRNTRDVVVRRELLFHEGDPYDPRLVAETERNLRRLPLFRKVESQVKPVPGDAVEVVVHVYDNWTITPTASFKRAGGLNAYKFGVKDSNLQGWGKTAGVLYADTFEEIEKNLFFEDPQFMGRRLNAGWGVRQGNESNTYYATLARPFFATVSRDSMGVYAAYRDEKIRHEFAVVPFGHVRRRVKEGSVFYGRSLGSTPSLIQRAVFEVAYSRERLEAVPGESVITGDSLEVTTTLSAKFVSEQQAFVKERNIKRLYRDEDINLGWFGSMSMAVSPRYLGASTNSASQRVAVGKGAFFGTGHFAKGETSAQMRVSGEALTSVIWNVNLEYYRRLASWSTLATHFGYDYGHALNPTNALLLGELEGLRGYGLYHISGNRRMLFNLEDRVFVKDNLFQLFCVGAVVFFDAGTAWTGGESVAMGSWKTSAGAGLRFGSSRGTGGSPLRIDFAYAFNNNGLGSPLSVSILTGQAF